MHCDYISKPPLLTYPTRKLVGERCVLMLWTTLEKFKCKCIKTWFIFTTEPWNFFQGDPSMLVCLGSVGYGDAERLSYHGQFWFVGFLEAGSFLMGVIFVLGLFCSLQNSLAWRLSPCLQVNVFPLRPTQWLRSKASYLAQYVSCFLLLPDVREL